MVVNMYKKMLEALVPSNMEKQYKKDKGTVKDGIIIYFLAWVVSFILSLAGSYLLVNSPAPEMQQMVALFGQEAIATITMGAVIMSSIIGLVTGIIGIYVALFAGDKVANSVFKGKGKFEQAFYAVMLLAGGFTLVSAVLGLLIYIVPAIAGIVAILILLFALYVLYLFVSGIKAVYGMGLLGTLVTLVVMVIVFFVVGIILELILRPILAIILGALGLLQG